MTATEREIVNVMAGDLPHTIDLADDLAIARELSGRGFMLQEIYARLPRIKERAKQLRRSEILRDSMVGAFTFAALIALTCVGTLIPTEAMAATLGGRDWPSVALRFVFMLGLFAITCGLVAAVFWFMFPAKIDMYPEDTDDTSDIERRRRNAGGE